jgi:hypothetical protein
VPDGIAKPPVTLFKLTRPEVAVNSKMPLLSPVLVMPVMPEIAPLSALMIDVMFFSF